MSGGGQQQGTSTTQQTMSPEQQQLMKLMMPGIEQHITNPVQAPPGSQIADYNPIQLQAQRMMLNTVGMDSNLSPIGGYQRTMPAPPTPPKYATAGDIKYDQLTPEQLAAANTNVTTQARDLYGKLYTSGTPVNADSPGAVPDPANPGKYIYDPNSLSYDLSKPAGPNDQVSLATLQRQFPDLSMAEVLKLANGTRVPGTPDPIPATASNPSTITVTGPNGQQYQVPAASLGPEFQGRAGTDTMRATNGGTAVAPQGGVVGQIAGSAANTLQTLLSGGGGDINSPEMQAAISQLLSGNASQFATPGKTAVNYQGPIDTASIADTGVNPFSIASLYNPNINANLTAAALAGPGQVSGTDPRLNRALDFLMGPALDPQNNPALQSAIQAAIRPVTDTYSQTVMPGIRSEAINNNMMGSNRQGIAEGIASKGLMNQVGDIASKLSNEGYNAGLDALTKATTSSQQALVSNLQTMLNDEATRLGISADALTKSMVAQLQAETQRQATATGANIATAQINADLQKAGIAADTSLLSEQMRQNSALQQATMQSQSQALGALLQNKAAMKGISVDAMMQGLSQSDKTAILQTLPATIASGVGDMQQAMQQAHLSEDAQKFIAEQMKGFASIQDVAQLFFGMPSGTTTTSTGPAPNSGLANTALSAAATIGAALIMSDRRLKSAIELVGRLKNGIGLYKFKYFGRGLEQFGVMADEVRKVLPSAVVRRGEFDMVALDQVLSTQFA